MSETLRLLRNRTYAKLILALFTSQLGSMISVTTLLLYFLDHFTHGTNYATLMEFVKTFPILLVFFIIGVVADRFDRKIIALWTDILCGGLSLVLVFILHTHSLLLILLILFTQAMIQSFFSPAQTGLVQGILSKDDYVTASGFNQLIQGAIFIFCTAIGVVLYTTLGATGAILIDALTYFLSFALTKSCSFTEDVRLPNGQDTLKHLSLKNLLSDYRDGIRYIQSNKIIGVLMLSFIVLGIYNCMMTVLPMYTFKYELNPHDYKMSIAILDSLTGLGALFGSLYFAHKSKKWKPIQLIIGGFLVLGVSYAVIGLTHDIIVFDGLFVIACFVVPGLTMGIMGWMLSLIDKKMIGRVMGCINPLMMASQSISYVILYVLYPKLLSITDFWLSLSIILLLAFAVYAVVLPKFLRN